MGWSRQWDTDMQQQALRIAPILGLNGSHPTPGQWRQHAFSTPTYCTSIFAFHMYPTRHFSVQDISFLVQKKIKAIAGFHFHTLSSNPGSYWQQSALSMQFSPIICENRDVEEANYLLERRKLLAYNWVLRAWCPLLEPHSSSHLPLRAGVLFLFKF